MGNENRIIFNPFCLDRTNECLWRGSQVIKLRPKAFAVLNQLVGRPGQLVTKEELLNTVWRDTFVGDAVLKVAIRQLRDALEDNSKAPEFIETAHRRGYRFIGQITESGQTLTETQNVLSHRTVTSLSVVVPYSSVGVVEREVALSRMQSCLENVLGGQRQIIFVAGEAGIGKTTLVDTFTKGIASDQTIRICRGQCLERYGTNEAYLPVLDAIARLCRQQPEVVDVLRAHAPMWLLQMPSLVSASDRELLSREVLGATRERMLREMGEALDTLTSDQPLVLILEDLHWSDYSTLDLISYLANQRQPARLMLIGTYRTVELIVSAHPLKEVKQELLAKQQCAELPLDYLSEDAVAEYLFLRFPTNRFPSELARLIHERTEGHPLFMVNVLNYLLAEQLIFQTGEHWILNTRLEELDVGVPENIREMIGKQIARLTVEDQQLLEAASISGMNFSALAIASALGKDVVEVEAKCEELARRNCFLRVRGVAEFPDGTVSGRYGFIHWLYVSTLYERIPAARRARLHKDMAERGESIYGNRAGEIGTELAVHFEQGRDYQRAAKYLQKAADNAIRRFAYREAVGLARRGLELLLKLPDSAERAEQELCLQLTLGVPLVATEGYAAPDVGSAYARARELCRQLGETPEISEVLWGLRSFHALRSDWGPAREIAGEALRLAERHEYPGLAMRGHWMMLSNSMHHGEFALAIEHFEKALSHYDPGRHRDDAFLYALNPGVAMPCLAAWVLWFLGKPDQSLEQIYEGLTLAHELSEPNCLGHAFFFAAVLYQLRREDRMAQQQAEAAIAVSREHGLVMYEVMATVIRGWSLFEQQRHEEGIEQMREGLEALKATRTEFVRPHFLALLADALGKAGQHDEGLLVLEAALSLVGNGERYYEAELYRLKGELLLTQLNYRSVSRKATRTSVVADPNPSVVAQVEDCFKESIRIARQQKAKSWELRAIISIARLFMNQGKQAEARSLLTQIYDEFTEGFDTVELREARALLDELS